MQPNILFIIFTIINFIYFFAVRLFFNQFYYYFCINFFFWLCRFCWTTCSQPSPTTRRKPAALSSWARCAFFLAFFMLCRTAFWIVRNVSYKCVTLLVCCFSFCFDIIIIFCFVSLFLYHQVDIAEALVMRGLATVVHYRHDDDQRARNYSGLLQVWCKKFLGFTGEMQHVGIRDTNVHQSL